MEWSSNCVGDPFWDEGQGEDNQPLFALVIKHVSVASLPGVSGIGERSVLTHINELDAVRGYSSTYSSN